jgi:hypothetical protein
MGSISINNQKVSELPSESCSILDERDHLDIIPSSNGSSDSKNSDKENTNSKNKIISRINNSSITPQNQKS